jgi:hypothetical protein
MATDPIVTASLISLLVITGSKLLMTLFKRVKNSECMGVKLNFTSGSGSEGSDKTETIELP